MKKPTLKTYRGRGTQPWRWRLRAANGKTISTSHEGYSSRAHAERAAETVRDAFKKCVFEKALA